MVANHEHYFWKYKTLKYKLKTLFGGNIKIPPAGQKLSFGLLVHTLDNEPAVFTRAVEWLKSRASPKENLEEDLKQLIDEFNLLNNQTKVFEIRLNEWLESRQLSSGHLLNSTSVARDELKQVELEQIEQKEQAQRNTERNQLPEVQTPRRRKVQSPLGRQVTVHDITKLRHQPHASR
jgi:hypothetical protein